MIRYFSKLIVRASGLLLAGAVLFGAAGCAASSSSSQQWSGDLARTYNADVSAVVNAASEVVQNIGMGVDSRQPDENTYVVEATKKSGSTLGSGERVQLTGLSIYVRSMGEVGTNLQVRIPEQSSSYASRRDDSYARKQARRILTVLDERFQKSAVVQ